jgi:cellulose biosynthesis protein BcsQ
MTGGIVFFGGIKGGVGKSATSHAACLGAILRHQAAVYVLTDPKRRLRAEGRPYGVLDGREPRMLAHILSESRNGLGGWTIIDGGGNRPAFDEEIAAVADLCILPFRASEEDLDMVADDLRRIPNSVAWPTAWPTNPYASRAAAFMIEALVKAFPLRVINPPIPFVNSVADLLASSLGSPSSPVRQMSCKVFDVMAEEFDNRKPRFSDPSTHEEAKPGRGV